MPDDLGVEFIEEKTSVDERIERKKIERPEGFTGYVKEKTGIHEKKVSYLLIVLAITFFIISLVFVFIGLDKRKDFTERVFVDKEVLEL
jgi:hypothetical protein